MTDEIPENVDLQFLAAQLGKVLGGQHELREGQRETNERLAKLEQPPHLEFWHHLF